MSCRRVSVCSPISLDEMRDDSKKRNTNIVTVLWEDLAKGGQLENDANDDEGNYDKQKQRILRFIHTHTLLQSNPTECLRNNDDY